MQLSQVKELEQRYLAGTYARYEILVDRGSGAYLIDKHNKRYLDFLSGIGVNALGYNHPRVKQILRKQIKRPLHTSNLIYHEYQGRLAERLCTLSGLDRAFFTNSGAESMEGCFKFARLFVNRDMQGSQDSPRRFKILALEDSFHGRTFGALSATGTEKYRTPFEPLVPGFEFVRFNDVEDLENKFKPDVCAFVMETIQGEGGIRPVSRSFYLHARQLATRYGALLICDEVQSGLGRTGRWFAYERFASQSSKEALPDLLAVAKPLGLGIPMGAILMRSEIASSIKVGDHGTTFGGGPLACRTSLEFFKIVEEQHLLAHIQNVGCHFKERLQELRDLPVVREIRGEGLMLAVELSVPGKEIVKKLLEQGFIVNCTHESVLRFLPPYIITEEQIAKLMRALRPLLENYHA